MTRKLVPLFFLTPNFHYFSCSILGLSSYEFSASAETLKWPVSLIICIFVSEAIVKYMKWSLMKEKKKLKSALKIWNEHEEK